VTQKHGRRFEHELVNGLDKITPNEVWVTTAGYSGSAVADACDLVITLDPKLKVRGDPNQVNIEAKKRQGKSGNRVSVFSGSETDETGLEEVQRLVDGTPDWSDSIVAIKFDRRKLVVLDARWILSALDECDTPVPSGVKLHEPRLTPSDNISMVKPSLDDWASATAADSDEVVLAHRLGLPFSEVEDDDG